MPGDITASEARRQSRPQLRGIGAANFRAFDERVQIDLAPLTLLFGENNAGKSGLLRLLPFIADSFDPRISTPLNLTSASLRGAGFSDAICRTTQSQALELSLEWSNAAIEIHFRELEDSVRASWFRIRYEGMEAPFEATWLGPGALYQLADGGTAVIGFRGPIPLLGEGLPPAFSALSTMAAEIPRDVLWLEATRDPIPREEPAPRAVPIDIGSRGQRAVATCASDDDVRRYVSDWFQRHFNLEFVLQRSASYVRPELRWRSSPFGIPLPDCGDGFSQALPVVVAAALAALGKGPRILCFEHPELHLHPDAHNSIATLFADLVSNAPDARIVAETHSESILLSVLLAIAEGRLSPGKVALYWVRKRGDGTSAVDSVPIDADGRLGPEFPPGVFRRATELARQLIAARQNQP